MKKGITIAMAIILALFVAGIIVVYSSIGNVISETIAAKGSEITQTNVTLNEVEYSANTGLATLVHMQIENPSGFKTKHAITFDKIELWIDPETLNTSVIRVKAMTLVAPEIVYEISDRSDNLRTLKRYMENAVVKNSPYGPDKKIIIENFHMKNGVVFVQTDDLNGSRKTAKLADLKLTNIGGDEGGLSPKDLSLRLLLPILRETTIAALSTDLSLSDQAKNILNGAMDETESALRLFKNLLKN
ncbi:MAG: hypothetical protein V7727_19720 [Sneathiella sp.]